MNLVHEDGDWLDTEGYWIEPKWACHHCSDLDEYGNPTKPVKFADERYSLGIYAGKYCDECWDKSGYRKEGIEGFDPNYAGESYWEEE